jgi:hypothetical protein
MFEIWSDEIIFTPNVWVLGNLFENFENPLWSSSLICQVLPKPYDEISWKPYTHMLLVVALSFVKLLWPLWEFVSCFHDQDARTRQHPLCYAQLRASIVPSIYSTKWISTLCVDLSLSPPKLILQKRHGYRKKYGHMKVQVKKRKKWTHEGPSEKRKKKLDTWRSKKKENIAMSTKESKEREDHAK